jgi:hypothetical protein
MTITKVQLSIVPNLPSMVPLNQSGAARPYSGVNEVEVAGAAVAGDNARALLHKVSNVAKLVLLLLLLSMASCRYQCWRR